MEAPLPGTDYYEQRTVAKSAWHFDFHANPDIAVYLTHGRERWYITRFFDDLAYQPDAISQDDLDVYARAFEAPGAMRALCEIYRELDHDADIHRADIAAHGKLTVPILASGGGAQTLAVNYAPMCQEIAFDLTGHLVPTPAIGSPRRTLTTSVVCSSTSTPQPEPDSRVDRTIDTSKAVLMRCRQCMHWSELDAVQQSPSGACVEWSASHIRATCGAKSANFGFTYSASRCGSPTGSAQASG
jgi:hypothetical protein